MNRCSARREKRMEVDVCGLRREGCVLSDRKGDSAAKEGMFIYLVLFGAVVDPRGRPHDMLFSFRCPVLM
jgi:hypothetical protein